MEAKEKAKELIEKFKPYSYDGYCELYGQDKEALKESALKSALVCTDEILEELGIELKLAYEYWQKVKKELQIKLEQI